MHTPERGSVALVDDEENIRETVGYALRREGYRVELFADGRAAWDAFQHRAPDVAILDITLPRMDGLELCRRLRGLSEALPIIFLTSRDEELDRVLGLELGADDYLCKPFSMRRGATLFIASSLRRFAGLAWLRGRPPGNLAPACQIPGPFSVLEGYGQAAALRAPGWLAGRGLEPDPPGPAPAAPFRGDQRAHSSSAPWARPSVSSRSRSVP